MNDMEFFLAMKLHNKELLSELCDVAVLFHASGALRFKIYDVLEKHLANEEVLSIVDRGCYERGCACYDDRVDKDGVVVSMIEVSGGDK